MPEGSRRTTESSSTRRSGFGYSGSLPGLNLVMIATSFPPARDRPLGSAAHSEREEAGHGNTHLRYLRRRRFLPLSALRLRPDARGGRTTDRLPSCGGSEFTRASLFSAERASPGSTTETSQAQLVVPVTPDLGARLAEARAHVSEPGQYLVYEDGDELRIVGAEARVDTHRAQPGGRRSLRRSNRLAPARPDRPLARRCPAAGRPQPQRRLRQRREDRRAGCSRTATKSSSGATG